MSDTPSSVPIILPLHTTRTLVANPWTQNRIYQTFPKQTYWPDPYIVMQISLMHSPDEHSPSWRHLEHLFPDGAVTVPGSRRLSLPFPTKTKHCPLTHRSSEPQLPDSQELQLLSSFSQQNKSLTWGMMLILVGIFRLYPEARRQCPEYHNPSVKMKKVATIRAHLVNVESFHIAFGLAMLCCLRIKKIEVPVEECKWIQDKQSDGLLIFTSLTIILLSAAIMSRNLAVFKKYDSATCLQM